MRTTKDKAVDYFIYWATGTFIALCIVVAGIVNIMQQPEPITNGVIVSKDHEFGEKNYKWNCELTDGSGNCKQTAQPSPDRWTITVEKNGVQKTMFVTEEIYGNCHINKMWSEEGGCQQ